MQWKHHERKEQTCFLASRYNKHVFNCFVAANIILLKQTNQKPVHVPWQTSGVFRCCGCKGSRSDTVVTLTHGDASIGRFLPNNEPIDLLKCLLFALPFKTLQRQLSEGLVELLKRNHTSRLCPKKIHRVAFNKSRQMSLFHCGC